MPSSQVIEAIAVTAELCGRVMSPGAAAVFCSDLEAYDDAAVLKALTRCRKEVRGALTVADVVTRLDDGRPGPEEAWSLVPRSESSTVVWTDEMSQAFGVACPLLEAGEEVAARMAFKETYTRLVNEAREERRPVKWTPSLGHDPHGREGPVMEAVKKGRLTHEHAAGLLPHYSGTRSIGGALTFEQAVVGALQHLEPTVAE